MRLKMPLARAFAPMKNILMCTLLAALILAGGAIAQTPPGDNNTVVPSRSIRITAEQGHVIKEIVLKDKPGESSGSGQSEPAIGDKVPANARLQNFPETVWDKVPQVRTHKFYIANGQVVIVSPSDNTVADILK
jgi:hypothetical protein